jgi:hypothetical protein
MPKIFDPTVVVLTLGIPVLLATVALRWRSVVGPYMPEEQHWTVDATRIRLSDGRFIAYEVVGNKDMHNAIFWFHGVVSSRYPSLLKITRAVFRSHPSVRSTKDI